MHQPARWFIRPISTLHILKRRAQPFAFSERVGTENRAHDENGGQWLSGQWVVGDLVVANIRWDGQLSPTSAAEKQKYLPYIIIVSGHVAL